MNKTRYQTPYDLNIILDEARTQNIKSDLYKGLSTSTAQKRRAEANRRMERQQDGKSVPNKPLPGDSKGQTKPSKYTTKYKSMFGDNSEEEETMITYDDGVGCESCEEYMNEKKKTKKSTVDTALKNKADSTGWPMRTLRAVYNRGLAAWRTSHRPGAGQHQWAMARVNSFVTGGKTSKTADKDLYQKNKSKKKKK